MSRKQKPQNTFFEDPYPRKNNQKSAPLVVKPLGFKTKRQQTYYESIMENVITVSTGVAGTGKSYVAVHAALQSLAAGEVDEIIMTKPNVDVGEGMGHLPGDADEKMAPYVASIENCIIDIIGEEGLRKLKQKNQLRILPLNFVRGLTLKNCFVIADEMQNASPAQMKALLTRIGEDAVYVINGDVEQCDLKKSSGLPIAIEVLQDIDGVGFVDFTIDDIVRSGICKDIIIGYHNYEHKD